MASRTNKYAHINNPAMFKAFVKYVKTCKQCTAKNLAWYISQYDKVDGVRATYQTRAENVRDLLAHAKVTNLHTVIWTEYTFQRVAKYL